MTRDIAFPPGALHLGHLTPADAPSDIAVVLLNAGAIRRCGPFRLHVHAARAFAERGFPTLRFDQPGIGDHLPAAQKPQVDVIRDLLDELERASGSRRFVLGGICAAADLAWKVALADDRVAGLLLLDPLARREAPGFRLGQIQLVLRRGPRGWFDILARRLRRESGAPRMTDAELRDWPAPGTEAEELSRLAARGVACFFLYTGGAASYFTHPRQFHSGFGPAARHPRVHFEHWRGCDHLFLRPADRERLVERLSAWLSDTFRGSDARSPTRSTTA